MSPPSYKNLLEQGIYQNKVREAYEHLQKCDLCGWKCGVDRTAGKFGVCKTAVNAVVSSFAPHHGEEYPLRGKYGSGTIFFSSCNLRCQYCQNYEISQYRQGIEVTPHELAQMMLSLQKQGCHNINLVSPSHVIYPIIAAIGIAAEEGLIIPIVYNTGGYDSLEGLSLMDGIVDIYMPDMNYASQTIARKYSKIPNYPAINQLAVKEMHRQVGDLIMDEQGIAIRGLLIRHLVLPNNLAGSEKIIRFIAQEISTNTYLNIMGQYYPTYLARQYPPLNRRVTYNEVQTVIEMARVAGLTRLD